MKLWKSTSSEILYAAKLALWESSWKFSSPKKLDANCFSEKIAVLKKYLFSGSDFVEKVTVLKNLIPCRTACLRSFSVDIDILNKFVFLKSGCSEKLAALKNYLFSRWSWSVETLPQISNFFKKITAERKWVFWKSSYSKKVVALIK